MSSISPVRPQPSSEFRKQVEKISGQKVQRCYQCGKCNAGCPSSYAMDMGPRKIIRAVQLGLKEEALKSNSIWVCLFCYTCSARCPLEIDIGKVMESCRTLANKETVAAPEKDVALLYRLFLSSLPLYGRFHELSLGMAFNLLSGHLFSNVNVLPEMLSKGKLTILPDKVKGSAEVAAIIKRVLKSKEQTAEGQQQKPDSKELK